MQITMSPKWMFALALGVATAFGVAPASRAQNNDAAKILKEMSDYLAGQKTLSATFDTSIEVITPQLQKIQFNSTGQLLMSRPNKLRATRRGGYADVEFIFDGKTFTVFDKNDNMYVQSNSPTSIDELLSNLRTKYAIEAPGAVLLVSHPYNELEQGVLEAMDIGPAIIDGVECEQLAFRTHDVDWQIWIEKGPKPIPRKFVITSKTVAGAPQYTLLVRDWKTNVPVNAGMFAFNSPEGAKKVAFKDLPDVDEVPPGQVQGEKQ